MLIAVDTNVPLDLAGGVEDVVDALAVIRQRIKSARLIAPPTVNLELAFLSQFAEEEMVRANAQTALRSLASKWKIQPANLVPVGHGIVATIGSKLCADDLLPDEEHHDALILAESALLGCSFLLSSDAHLRGMDYQRLKLLLQDFHVAAPIVATPREIVRKFFR
ncbi:MAG: DNA-binding protein [Verrucomicrobiae bacterium]